MDREPGIYGYPSRGPLDEYGQFEMKEVSFGMPPDLLREVARFLQGAADEIDAGTGDRIYWHRHIDEHVEDWRERCPGVDIVVVDLNTYVDLDTHEDEH